MLFTLGLTIPYPIVHLQPVYHGQLDVHKAAVSWPLLPRRWLLCHHIRCQTLSLPWHLHLHSSPGRRSPRAGGQGTVHPCLTYSPSQSPRLPNEGTLMAVYDKSGYSHSETSLVSLIYLSKKVSLPALSQAHAKSHCPQASIWLLLLFLLPLCPSRTKLSSQRMRWSPTTGTPKCCHTRHVSPSGASTGNSVLSCLWGMAVGTAFLALKSCRQHHHLQADIHPPPDGYHLRAGTCVPDAACLPGLHHSRAPVQRPDQR